MYSAIFPYIRVFQMFFHTVYRNFSHFPLDILLPNNLNLQPCLPRRTIHHLVIHCNYCRYIPLNFDGHTNWSYFWYIYCNVVNYGVLFQHHSRFEIYACHTPCKYGRSNSFERLGKVVGPHLKLFHWCGNISRVIFLFKNSEQKFLVVEGSCSATNPRWVCLIGIGGGRKRPSNTLKISFSAVRSTIHHDI